MFFHQFKYAIINILKSKTIVFWTMLFPIALSTFMFLAFGRLFEEDFFQSMPIAIVEESSENHFSEVLHELEKGEEPLVQIVDTKDRAEAEQLLEDKKIKGFYVLGEDIALVIKENGIEQSILNEIMLQYKQYQKIIEVTSANHPENLPLVLEQLGKDVYACKEVESSNGNQDNMVLYLYAVFAMGCLFAGFTGLDRCQKMQADMSAIGMRRCLAPHSKFITIISEFSAMVLMQFLYQIVALLYMSFVLKIDFGNKVPAILLLLFIGCTIGISIGIIVGSVSNKSADEKQTIITVISMLCCVLADLVVAGIREMIEKSAPIINRLNPAALIVDSFYALSVYDNYDRFIKNISILCSMTAVLLVVSYLLVRRVRYAHL